MMYGHNPPPLPRFVGDQPLPERPVSSGALAEAHVLAPAPAAAAAQASAALLATGVSRSVELLGTADGSDKGSAGEAEDDRS